MNAPEIHENSDVSELSMGSSEDYPAEEIEGGSEDDIPVVGSDAEGSW
jgi:hypothetical protein